MRFCKQPDVLLRQFATRGDAPNLQGLLEFCAREKSEETTTDEVTKVETTVVTYIAAEGIDFKEGAREEGCPGWVEGKKVDFKGRAIDVRNTHNGFTAFHWCCQNGSDAAVTASEQAAEALEQEKKADPKAKDKTNPAPVRVYSSLWSPRSWSSFVAHFGLTLAGFCTQDHVKCMQLMLEWGSNPTLLDFMGRTGRDLAALKGNFKMVEALDVYIAEHPWKEDE